MSYGPASTHRKRLSPGKPRKAVDPSLLFYMDTPDRATVYSFGGTLRTFGANDSRFSRVLVQFEHVRADLRAHATSDAFVRIKRYDHDYGHLLPRDDCSAGHDPRQTGSGHATVRFNGAPRRPLPRPPRWRDEATPCIPERLSFEAPWKPGTRPLPRPSLRIPGQPGAFPLRCFLRA